MKKMKRFQDGGFTKEQEEWLGGADRTDPYILARMRKAVPDAPKTQKAEAKVDAGELRDETGTLSKMRRNTETGELYSTEDSPKPTVKSSSVAATKKPVTVKKETTEVVIEKEEPKKAVNSSVRNDKKKSSDAEPSFLRGTKGYNLSDITDKVKSMLPEGNDRRTEKQKAAGEEASFLRGTKGYNLPDFKMPEGSDRRTEKQKAAGEEPSFLRGTKGYSLSDFTKGGSKKDPAYSDAGYKKGGKVSSASKRADGCAIRGKTRA
jgi:hypothetical protein